jgi:hypothetical protein
MREYYLFLVINYVKHFDGVDFRFRTGLSMSLHYTKTEFSLQISFYSVKSW